jgi:adenine-specific DNA-methyltransferase
VRRLCDEVFGEENFLATLIWKSKSGGANDSSDFAVDHEYVIVYARSKADFVLRLDPEAEVTTSYNRRDEKGEFALDRLDKQSIRYSPTLDYEITGPDGRKYRPAHKNPSQPNASWRWSKAKVEAEYDKLVFENGYVYTKNYKSDGAVPRSLLTEERFGRTRTGKTECAELMGSEIFSNPKPTKLIRHLVRIASMESELIVDFFAGSGTTGHAVMAQNAADSSNRRYILVQLPERLDFEDKDQKVAADYCKKLKKPLTIAELTKERLRRAAKRIKEETPMFAGDLGFRVFKLDSTNIQEWEPKSEDLTQTLAESVEHLKTDRSEADILYELLLKLGLDLCVPIEKRAIAGKDVHAIGGGVLMACLPEKITAAEVEKLGLGIVEWHKALVPAGDTTCVFRDSAFADDVAKTNLAAILNQNGIATVRSL